ncbi:MAG: tetratricopeptide repeat protein [Cyanobacteriota bacterium]
MLQTRRWQKAIEDYTQALDINPNFTEAYTNRGVARFDLGDTQGAIDDYTLALQLNPNFAVAYNNR